MLIILRRRKTKPNKKKLIFSCNILGNNNADFLSSLDESDDRLIQIIKNWFIEYPDPNAAYSFSKPEPGTVILTHIGISRNSNTE